MASAASTSNFKVRNVLEGWEDPNQPLISKHLPNPPFRWLVIAPSGSGKTNVITQYLTQFSVVDGHSIFSRIVIFSPSVRSDPHFRFIAQHTTMGDVLEMYDELDLDYIHEIVAGTGGTPQGQTLVYIDDFAFDKKVFETPEMKELFFRGRHNNVSSIISSQYFFSVPPQIRTNASHYCIFRLGRESELSYIQRDLTTMDVNAEMLGWMVADATKKKHGFLYIDMTNHKYYRDFEHEYRVEDDDDDEKEVDEVKQAIDIDPRSEDEKRADDIAKRVLDKIRAEKLKERNSGAAAGTSG